jgi:hypothetical protein
MNTLKLMPLIMLFALAFSANAIQYKFVAGDDSFATKVCVLAGSDNKGKLKRSKQHSFDNGRSIANSVRCNDMPIAHFAKKYNAMNTFKYLNRLAKPSLREYDTKVEIQDITSAAINSGGEGVQIIYVRSAQ